MLHVKQFCPIYIRPCPFARCKLLYHYGTNLIVVIREKVWVVSILGNCLFRLSRGTGFAPAPLDSWQGIDCLGTHLRCHTVDYAIITCGMVSCVTITYDVVVSTTDWQWDGCDCNDCAVNDCGCNHHTWACVAYSVRA